MKQIVRERLRLINAAPTYIVLTPLCCLDSLATCGTEYLLRTLENRNMIQ